MAITIQQQPYSYTALKQKLIVVATSTQVGQPGFRYVIEVSINGGAVNTFYVQPNLSGALVFDLYPVVYANMDLGVNSSDVVASLFASATVQDDSTARNIMTVSADIYEGYEVLGLFTVQATAYPLDELSLINAAFQISDGFNPDPNAYFALIDQSSYIMSDLKRSTYAMDDLLTQYSLGNKVIGITGFEDDWGVLTIPADDGTKLIDNEINYVSILQFNQAGIIQSNTLPCVIAAGTINHLPLMPANIDNIFGLQATWNHYLISFRTAAGTPCSQGIAVFKAADECRFDKIRLGWTNSRGGWDYFNFTKRSEENYSVERKRYRKVVGNYGTADYHSPGFTFNTYDRGLTERTPFVEKMLKVRTDFLTEGQFEYLKNLVYSESVYIINTDGSATPVVVDSNNYTAIRSRSYVKTDLELMLKFSNDYTA